MEIKKSKLDIIIEVICILLLAGPVLYVILNWANIPDKIPMHFDFAGNVDRWGEKGEVIILLVISWMMYGFLTVVQKFPQVWNTGVKVTEENKERVYRTLKNMINTLKLIVIIDFSFMTISILAGKELPLWFLPVFLGVTFGNLIFWLVKLVRVK